MINNMDLYTLKDLKSIDKLNKSFNMNAIIEGNNFLPRFRNLDVIEIDLNATPQNNDYVVVAYEKRDVSFNETTDKPELVINIELTIGKYHYENLGFNIYRIDNLKNDTFSPKIISNLDIAKNKIVGVVVGCETPTYPMGKIDDDSLYQLGVFNTIHYQKVPLN